MYSFTNTHNVPLPAVYETASLNDNLEHNGGLTIRWNAAEKVDIPLGAWVEYEGTRYVMLEPYAPTKESAIPHYRYEPSFKHPVAMLDRIPFWITTLDSEGHSVPLRTISFTGFPKDIIQKLTDFFAEYVATTGDTFFEDTIGTAWGWEVQGSVTLDTAIITVSFDGCSIKSAATAIANAMSCNVFFDWVEKKIRYIGGTQLDGEVYNCYHVLGGTTNMGKIATHGQGTYSAVTKRLALDETRYPASIIKHAEEGEIMLTTELIFDAVYPKMELYIKSVRERRCYLTNEEGEKISDGDGGYKQFAKWYITLATDSTLQTDYVFDQSLLINDKPLTMLFQPDLNAQVASPLAGRQFELVHFDDNTPEWSENDVLPRENPFVAQAGEYRIIVAAEGEELLPSIHEKLMTPRVGNKVTLVNMALGNAEKALAQTALEAAALEVIALMENRKAEYTETQIGDIPEVGSVVDDGSSPLNGYVVVRVDKDVDTEVAQVTYGSWNSRKTLTGSVVDKVDNASVGSTTATQNDGSVDSTTSTGVTQEQHYALMQTMNKPDYKTQIEELAADVEAVKEQKDRRFAIWYGAAAPTTSSYPASEWTTIELRDEHLEDIYFNVTLPAGSAGRVYRYEKVTQNNETTYQWVSVTDVDTLAAYEKMADAVLDGILRAGAEKERVYNEYKVMVETYLSYIRWNAKHSISPRQTYVDFMDAAWGVYDILNGGSHATGTAIDKLPLWIDLQHYTEDTKLSEYNITKSQYRNAWDTYYEKLAAVRTATDNAVQEVADDTKTRAYLATQVFVSNTLPTPPYKEGDMWFKVTDGTSGIMYTCVQERAVDDTPQETDWKVGESAKATSMTLTSLLAELMDAWEEWIKPAFEGREYVDDCVHVAIGSGSSAGSTEGDRWYDDGDLYKYHDDGYVSVDEDEQDKIAPILASLEEAGVRTFDIYHNGLYDQANIYDVFFARSNFRDSYTGEDIPGGLEVWVKEEDRWRKVWDGTTGLLQNYGDHIVAAVTGMTISEVRTAAEQGELNIGKNFIDLFVKVGDGDDPNGLKTRAGIEVVYNEEEDEGYVNITGTFTAADGDVRIKGETTGETYKDMEGGTYVPVPIEDYHRNVGMEFGDEENPYIQIGYDKEVLSVFGRDQEISPYILIEVKDPIGFIQQDHGRGYHIRRTEITPGKVKSGTFSIVEVNYFTGDVEPPVTETEYTGQTGTFQTADKDITVKGGIITGIENGGSGGGGSSKFVVVRMSYSGTRANYTLTDELDNGATEIYLYADDWYDAQPGSAIPFIAELPKAEDYQGRRLKVYITPRFQTVQSGTTYTYPWIYLSTYQGNNESESFTDPMGMKNDDSINYMYYNGGATNIDNYPTSTSIMSCGWVELISQLVTLEIGGNDVDVYRWVIIARSSMTGTKNSPQT